MVFEEERKVIIYNLENVYVEFFCIFEKEYKQEYKQSLRGENIFYSKFLMVSVM